MAKESKTSKLKATYQKYATGEAKQRAITFVAYILIVAVVIMSSIWQVLFGLENFNLTRFITNICFNIAITILTMMLAMRDGELANESSRESEYYKTKESFKIVVKKIVSRDSFRQFCDVLFFRERNDYIMTQLAEVNIYDDEYLKVNNEDFETLKNEPKICVVGHDSNGNEITKPLDNISEVQYEALAYYREGNFKFEKLEYTFFTSKSSRNSYRYQANLQQKQRNVKIWSIVYKVCAVIIIGTIFSFAMINRNTGDANYIRQSIFDTISRLLTMASAMFMGYTIANDEAKENVEALLFKIDIINQYEDERSTGAFVPKDIDKQVLDKINAIEKQRKEDEEKRIKEQQEAIANVITPEVVNEESKQEKTDYLELEMTEEEIKQLQIKNQK